MSYYRYRQNNSGGGWDSPAIEVFIEANSPTEADKIAIENGIYFDPDYEIDCECCGNRWSNAGDWDAWDEIPSLYETPLDEYLYGNFPRRLVIKGEQK